MKTAGRRAETESTRDRDETEAPLARTIEMPASVTDSSGASALSAAWTCTLPSSSMVVPAEPIVTPPCVDMFATTSISWLTTTAPLDSAIPSTSTSPPT